MAFSDFYGNLDTVTRLREMLARGRFPHAVILAGAEGSGKYTLAQMLAKTMNCLSPPRSFGAGLPDFCGRCSNCSRIAGADDLEARSTEAVEARELLREADSRDTRIFVQTHPEVLIIPPDPPQMMIKVDQVRRVIANIYYRPAEGQRRVYIFTDAPWMKEAANALLKILEEPPEHATLLLLARNPGQMLPTIRSRCLSFRLGPLSADEVEGYLAKTQPSWKPARRALVARLAGGAIGRAQSFDFEAYRAARQDALVILASPLGSGDHTSLFKVTETYRGGAEGRDQTERLIRVLYSLLADTLALKSEAPELVRNTDILADLRRLAGAVDFAWIAAAAQRLGEVERGMRRNLLRSLSLDAFAAGLELPGRP